MIINCIISGVGGQGTVLASKLIAAAAMEKGMDVRTAETIGMAQRGGSVVSHVRMGSDIHSPLIPFSSANVVIGFEPAEAVRVSPYLADRGVMIVCDSPIVPVSSSLSKDGYGMDDIIGYLKSNVEKLIVLDGARIIEKCGSVKTLNVALLGAAAQCGVFPFEYDELEAVVARNVPERFIEMNLTALTAGKKALELVQKNQ